MGNNGQMIVGTNNTNFNQNMQFMNNYNPYNQNVQQIQLMNNYQNPQLFNYNMMNQYPQQMQYGMYSAPINYNPYQIMNQQPLNNYTRGFNAPTFNTSGINNSVYGIQSNNNIIPINKENKLNQPIKLIGNNNTQNIVKQNNGNLKDMIANSTRETPNYNNNNLMSRREADKAKRSKSIQNRTNDNNTSNISHNYSNNNYTNNDNTGYEVNNDNYTNQDSFSRRRGHSSNRPKSNADGSYRPYTLTEYKEMSSNKIVLGKLGPNIGTKEWEEKAEKMKKLQEYSSKVSKYHKDVLNKVKESPLERIEKERREKNEQTSVHKAKQYAKLIKPRSRGDYDHSTLDETKETKLDSDFKNIMNFHNNNDNNNISNRIPSSKNRRYDDSILSNDLNKRESNSNELENLQKQRENYNIRINQIKESLLK